MNNNEVWIKVIELGFRRHSADVFVVIKRYKRKAGYGIFEKVRGFNGFWKSRKLGEAETINETVRFLTNYTNGMWRVSEDEVKQALEKAGWFWELEVMRA